MGIASALVSLRDSDGSRKLATILVFAATAILIVSCLLSKKTMPDFAFVFFLVSGALLIAWPRVAMPPVGQLLNQTPPRQFATMPPPPGACPTPPHAATGASACSTPPHAATEPAPDGLPTIICPGCRNTVSSLAKRCPYCGHPFRDMRASRHSRLAALLLCFFLGGLGIHRFYVGKFGTGILQLLTLGGLFIWTIIDLIFIVCGIFRDAEGKPLTEWDVR